MENDWNLEKGIWVRNTIETSICEILAHAAYSPDLALSDYHLFTSLGHALTEQSFSYTIRKKCTKIAR